MKPTPEQIKQIAIECGANFYAKEVQEFFTRAYELGWKNRGEGEWINPNDKTQAQYLPHIGELCLFSHDGITYYGSHTGGSFQTGRGKSARNFCTWECVWMYLPTAIRNNTGE